MPTQQRHCKALRGAHVSMQCKSGEQHMMRTQQEPHAAWSLTGESPPLPLQSTVLGTMWAGVLVVCTACSSAGGSGLY